MISIIIPALNEAENLAVLLPFLKKNSKGYNVEIIIADGGSTDHTGFIAKENGAMMLNTPEKGRAKQMNHGALHAQGEILYFLHADTFPPPLFLEDIFRNTNRGYKCGCFRLSFDESHFALKIFAWFTRFNIDVFRFGDQSLFVKKKLFKKIGGFNEHLLVMEDQEIVKKLKQEELFLILNKAVVTSARKYKKIGVFKLQFIFTIIVLLYYGKAEQDVIMHFYKNNITGNTY